MLNHDMKSFGKELQDLIKKHKIGEAVEMPDNLLAEFIVNVVQTLPIKELLDYHNCESIFQY